MHYRAASILTTSAAFLQWERLHAQPYPYWGCAGIVLTLLASPAVPLGLCDIGKSKDFKIVGFVCWYLQKGQANGQAGESRDATEYIAYIYIVTPGKTI